MPFSLISISHCEEREILKNQQKRFLYTTRNTIKIEILRQKKAYDLNFRHN